MKTISMNTGESPMFQMVDIGHSDYVAMVEPDTAFWGLVERKSVGDFKTIHRLTQLHEQKKEILEKEMSTLRFGLKPSAVYFNPTERCNLNCHYCYIPSKMRKNGKHMSAQDIVSALGILLKYFRKHMPKSETPQIIFHGAEPLLNKEAVFEGIREFSNDFRFGVQTNATLLDDEGIEFLTSHGVNIGLSLDGPEADIADRTRVNWGGRGVYQSTIDAMRKLRGYSAYNVICTITNENVDHLKSMVRLFHREEVPACMLNVLRCTLPVSRSLKSDDRHTARRFIEALEETSKLYKKTGRKLIVANFANILLALMAPGGRRLMCDISPCGGGRCFFAVAPGGDMFPCSEFIGLPEFNGGNLFKDNIDSVLESRPFKKVTSRNVDEIKDCDRCAIRHFCGSPCPAEAHEMNGDMKQKGAFCAFYEEQTRYALRLIADGRENDFLWKDWEKESTELIKI